jgi:hypothetical protein
MKHFYNIIIHLVFKITERVGFGVGVGLRVTVVDSPGRFGASACASPLGVQSGAAQRWRGSEGMRWRGEEMARRRDGEPKLMSFKDKRK